jgi:hypothetical protein
MTGESLVVSSESITSLAYFHHVSIPVMSPV